MRASTSSESLISKGSKFLSCAVDKIDVRGESGFEAYLEDEAEGVFEVGIAKGSGCALILLETVRRIVGHLVHLAYAERALWNLVVEASADIDLQLVMVDRDLDLGSLSLPEEPGLLLLRAHEKFLVALTILANSSPLGHRGRQDDLGG